MFLEHKPFLPQGLCTCSTHSSTSWPLLTFPIDLLNACLIVQAPQTQGAVVACADVGAVVAITQQLRVPLPPCPDLLPEPGLIRRPGRWVGLAPLPSCLQMPSVKDCPSDQPIIQPSRHRVFTEHLLCPALGGVVNKTGKSPCPCGAASQRVRQ